MLWFYALRANIIHPHVSMHFVRYGRHTPSGSSVTFVELVEQKGWIVESAQDGTVLEKATDGKLVVENITGTQRSN